MKTTKYEYEKVIQQNCGYGWDDVSTYEADSLGNAKDVKLLRTDLKEYNLMGYATRVIFRRTLKSK